MTDKNAQDLKRLAITFLIFLALNIVNISPAHADVTMQQLSSRLPFLNKSVDGLPSVNGVKPQDYLQIGNLGLGRTNLAGMSNATGVDSSKVSVTDLKSVLSGLKVQDLVNNKLSSDPRFNYQSKTLEQVPLLADLNKQLNLNLPGTTKISEIIKLPNFANASLGNVSPQVANLPISQAIPNFTQMPFGAVNNLEKAPISAFGGFNLQKMAFNQFPLSGAGFNVGLAKLNYTATGERVVQASRNACGGIPQPSFQVKAQTCTGTCKGFELLGGGSLNGSMCVEHQVPDGHGPLAIPTGGKAKSGNFPAGRELGLHLTNINNRDQALMTVNFQTCLYLPFVPDPWSCSSHVLPIPDGVPVMSVGRNTPIFFQAPSTLAAAPPASPILAQAVDKDQEITYANWGLFYRSEIMPEVPNA